MSKIRFYKYYFKDVDKPVIMEARDRNTADRMMQQLKETTNADISPRNLIDVRVETPIAGISKRKRKNQDFVWVGTEFTSDGWLTQLEYDEIQNLKQKQ